MTVIFLLSAVPGASYPSHPSFLNYVAHFGEYLVLAVLLTVLFTGSRFKRWQIVLLALGLAALYAVSDELHQLFVPGRSSDPVDVLTDAIGASVGALLTASVLKRIDGRRKRRM
jgi:VanZ family protein